MAQGILLAASPLNDTPVAREMAPDGFELTIAAPDTAEFNAALAEAAYFVGLTSGQMGDTFFKAAPKLRLVQLVSAGYDRVDIEAARRARVPVANNGGANSIAVAEHAMLLMLAVNRRLMWQHTNVVAGRWRGNDFASVRLYELHGKTLGIIGLGTIGKKVARLGRAFGLHVQYYDTARLTEDGEDAIGARFRAMPEVLRTSDIVSLHVPLTPATRKLIGARELGMMKNSAILINTCRGPVVDEAALVEALGNGTIAAAGLDVFEEEPTSPTNPLFQLDNVILTPHLAGPTWDNQYSRFRNAFDNVQRAARGEKPLWIIPELRDLF